MPAAVPLFSVYILNLLLILPLLVARPAWDAWVELESIGQDRPDESNFSVFLLNSYGVNGGVSSAKRENSTEMSESQISYSYIAKK